MSKLFELRPNKDLLDPTFEGYKLSLDPLPVYKHNVPVAVEHLLPNDQQFSYLHVKTFGLHNHLVDDPFYDEVAFFISKDLQVFQIDIHSLTSQNPEFRPVWEIPQSAKTDGRFNASLSFASLSLAVATDGEGCLYIVDACGRNSTNSLWQIKFSHKPSNGKPFKIMNSVFNTDSNNVEVLSVLVLKVEAIDEVESQIALSTFGCNQKETPFVNSLEWVEYQHKDGIWSFKQLKRIVIPHGLDYASVLNPGQSLCLIAREPFGIVYDSVKSVATPLSSNPVEGEKKIAYVWAESSDEVSIWMNFGKQISKLDLVVEINCQALQVVYNKQTCLSGELAHNIVVSSSSWTLSDGKLEIILSKADQSVNWDHLIHNDVRGQKVLDGESAAEWHHRLIHITPEEMEPGSVEYRSPIFSSEELEECDDVPVDEMHLFRLDGETNELTHKSILNGNQLLFITRATLGQSPGICLRHDVDGLVWEPMNDEAEKPWGCLHTATLQALGYIQASKKQRKFTVTPPNMTYAALCDAFTHVYIYRQSHCPSTGVEMVHRPTGRKVGNVARQQVLNIDSQEECLGALATNSFLLILTSSSLFAIRVNSD